MLAIASGGQVPPGRLVDRRRPPSGGRKGADQDRTQTHAFLLSLSTIPLYSVCLLILFCYLKKSNPQGFSEEHECLWVGLDWGNEKGRDLGGNEKQGSNYIL